MAAEHLSAEALRAIMSFNPDTGLFTRHKGRGGKPPEPIKGSRVKDGYLVLSIDRRLYQVHRLAFLYMTGAWPAGVVDHIDGVKDNNVWSNLRDVPRAVNMQNQRRARSDSQTGILGVSRSKRSGKYRAAIKTNGQWQHLGEFVSAEEAGAAYVAAKRMLHEACTI